MAATTYALTARGDLDDDEYAEAVAALGLPMVFELLTLVGYYATLALQLGSSGSPRPTGDARALTGRVTRTTIP